MTMDPTTAVTARRSGESAPCRRCGMATDQRVVLVDRTGGDRVGLALCSTCHQPRHRKTDPTDVAG